MEKQPLIQIEEMTKVFYTDEIETHALSGVHLTINKGEYVAMSGPSGCGKSTLLSIIGLLDTPTAGKYMLNSKPVENLDFSDRSRIRNQEIGFIFQTFNLLPRATALQNVELPMIYNSTKAEERLQKAKRALESVELGNRMSHKPNELSGGQRQRVAIARALVNSPSILLADEPTGNLDSRTGEDIMALFARLHQQGNSIILVTHERDIAEHADRIIHLRDGRIERDELLKHDRAAQVL